MTPVASLKGVLCPSCKGEIKWPIGIVHYSEGNELVDALVACEDGHVFEVSVKLVYGKG